MALLQFLQAAERQINPFDKNKTAKNTQGNKGKGTDIGSQVFSFLQGHRGSTVRANLEAQAKAEPNNQPLQRAVARPQQTTTPFESAVGLGIDAIRGTAKIPITASLSGAQVLSKPLEATGVIPQNYGESILGQVPAVFPKVLGNEPIQTYQNRAAGIKQKTGIPTPVAAAGLFGLDFLPGSRAPKSVVEQGINSLAKAGTVSEVNDILKGVNPAIVKRIAPAIIQTSDPNIVRNILDKYLSPSPPRIVPQTPPTPVANDINAAGQGSEQSITNPINPGLSQTEKVRALQRLSADNEPILKDAITKIDNRLGTSSKTSLKEPQNILAKANRPSILAEKPWHDVEHIRDSLRSKTVVNNLEDVPQVIDQLVKNTGAKIVKLDTAKMLNPKEWGFRFAAVDLKMPNGQLVEHYMPLQEVEAAKKAGNHELFEKWRNKTPDEINASRMEYANDLAKSNKAYQDAWDQHLSDHDLSDSDARASWANIEASLSGKGDQLSLRSSGIGGVASAQTPLVPRIAETGDLSPATQSRPSSALAAKNSGNFDGSLMLPSIKEKSPVVKIPTHGEIPSGIKEATIAQPIKGEAIPPPSKDPFDDIISAINGKPAAKGQSPIRGLASARAEQNVLLAKERGQRFATSGEAGKKLSGSAGYEAERAALRGQYSKADFNPLINDIGPKRAEELFSAAREKINAIPDSVYQTLPKPLHPQAARFNTQTAVRKVLGLEPGLPTSSEIRLLRLVNPKLADEAKTIIPPGRKIFDAAAVLFGNARSAKSTLDLSMGGRQGLFVSARHPEIWANANKESIKYAKSSKYYIQQMKALHDDEWGKLYDQYSPGLTGGASHEEQYPNTDVLAGKVAKKLGVGHLVAGSERAYTGGLTKIRHDIFASRMQAYGKTAEEAEQNLGQKGVAGLVESIDTLTGRGGKKGGWVQKHATTLQEGLFSPRLWASRLQPLNPAFWKRIGPAGRKEAIQSLGSFAAVAGTVLSAAVAAGAKVESDPRSSDFLKIKVGDTRYDILGGFQQNLVFGARQLSGSAKSSTSGRVTKYGDGYGSPTRLSASFDLLRNKANPVLGTGATIVEGKDKAGNKINPAVEIGKLFVPISIEGSIQSIKHEGSIPKGLAKNSPDIVGISTQTYGTKDLKISDKQQAYVNSIKDKNLQSASKLFYQTLKTTPDRNKVTEAIKNAPNDDAAIKIAKEYNQQYNKAFDEWRKQYGKYRTDENLVKSYKKRLITEDSFNRLRP